MIIAVDFDGTLALGTGQHISTLSPNRELIARLMEVRKTAGAYIKIVTARGAKGNLTDSEKYRKYLPEIIDWLHKYDVPFDEISFNKEYAHLYIDDQTIAPYAPFEGQTSAFTGNKVILTETTAIKYAPSALFEAEWYKEAAIRGFDVPKVLFTNDECIITQRLHNCRKPTAADFAEFLRSCRRILGNAQPYQTYLDNLPKEIEGATEKTAQCVGALKEMWHNDTFFHGDLSTTNVLCSDGKTYLIDPNCKHIFGSYLTDAGKAVFSLIAYEAQFPEAQKIVDEFGPEVWYFAVAEGLRVCKYQSKYISIVNNIADLI